MSPVTTVFLLLVVSLLMALSFWDSRQLYLRRREEQGILPLHVICDQCGRPQLVRFRGELKIKKVQATSRYDPPFEAPVAECPVCHVETPIVGETTHKLLELVANQ